VKSGGKRTPNYWIVQSEHSSKHRTLHSIDVDLHRYVIGYYHNSGQEHRRQRCSLTSDYPSAFLPLLAMERIQKNGQTINGDGAKGRVKECLAYKRDGSYRRG
jgi:hypothetical protein